jgi:hypothetical protein
MAAPALTRAIVDVVRSWSDRELTAAGTTLAELAHLRWGFVNLALQIGELELAQEWADAGYELAVQSGSPSSLAGALLAVGMARLTTDPDDALRAFAECIDLTRRGAWASGGNAALYQSALVYARRGDRAQATSQLIEAIETLRPRGRTAELDGACGYSIEILATLGLIEAAMVVVGSIFDGELRVLREVPVPPDRTPIDVRGVRETIGKARFDELLGVGARMSYDEVLDHIVSAATDA